jgi:transposase
MKILTDEQRELYSLLVKDYGAMVSQKNTAKVLNVSIATLYRMRENGVGVGYKKLDSKSKNGTVQYPLQEIVRFLTESNVKTA